MKKQNTLLIAVIVVLVLALGIFFSMSKKTASVQTAQTQTAVKPTEPNTKAEMLQASLKSLLTMGKTVKCTYTNTVKDVNVTGTVVASNGKMKQDFTSNTSAGPVSGHMIVDGTTAYMWTDQMKQGFKFALNEMPTPAVSGKTAQPQGSDLNKSLSMSCLPWSATPEAFTPPMMYSFGSE